MPIYAFECRECGLEFSIRATFQQKETGLQIECPQCRSRAVRQVMTAGLLLPSRGGATALPACGPNAKKGCCG